MKNVLAIAGDAGGARAVAPVVTEMTRRGIPVECRPYGPAVPIWEHYGLSARPFSTDLQGALALLLGTSVNSEQRELEAIASAAPARVRTVSIVDSWVHYRERFVAPDGSLRLPDVIAVADATAREQAIAAGLPARRIAVTGQPAFDDLPAVAARAAPTRSRTRRSLGTSDGVVVLYVSQPLHELYDPRRLGFDPRSVIADVVMALAQLFDRHARLGHLWVKLHPREMGRPYAIPASPGPHLRIDVLRDDRLAPRDLVVSSDLVVGMNSILLVEACLLRVPTVSYQPGILIDDPLPTNRLGWSVAVTDRKWLEDALEAELFNEVARARRQEILASASVTGGAAARIADIVLADLPV